MEQPDAQTTPNYVTCPCQHCSGKIEFDASTFDKGETCTVPCSHCGLETIIFVPEQKVPPVISDIKSLPARIGQVLSHFSDKTWDAQWESDLGVAYFRQKITAMLQNVLQRQPNRDTPKHNAIWAFVTWTD